MKLHSTIRVYMIRGFVDGAMHAHVTTTKAEAVAYIKDWIANSDFADLEYEILECDKSRAGVTRLLNDFIECTCFNEGG